MHAPRLIPMALAISALLAISACSSLDGERIDYRSERKASTLDIPPDLTQLSRDNRYVVPGASVSASGYKTEPNAPGVPVAANSVGDVRLMREGNVRWLVVDRPADKLWEPTRSFWQESGFALAIDQQNIGILETDWAENRAKIPQDFIRNTLGKLLDTLYSSGERDKFRTRFERNAAGSTEIYISHRGMAEQYKSTSDRSQGTIWAPRAADPELEAEFLRRLMVRLGVSPEQSKTVVAAATAPKQSSRVTSANGVPVVQVDEGFDRAWRRVGLALDRTGFTVEDRDRAQGLYFVRYVEPSAIKEEGLFSKLFSKNKDVAPLKYRIVLKSEGESTTVSVQNAQGAADSSANAQRMVQVIADDLK